jgi:trehalose 6-phosphate phosphatase
MSVRSSSIADLPSALGDELAQRIGELRPAVFLDYDGTLTPIVDRPQDAVISESMREAVSRLAARCTVCVVSGRDRPVVQELMSVFDLVVAGSHGFDIWSPVMGTIEHEAAGGFEDLLTSVTAHLRQALEPIEGAAVEPKRASVAAHYRLVAEAQRAQVKAVVDRLLDEHPGELKVTPGKMVFEIQPKLDWDKGRAVLHLLTVLGLDGDDVMPIYVGDDITDEHAFEALAGRGIGVIVADADDPEAGGRATAADFVLGSTDEVERFLDSLARSPRSSGGEADGRFHAGL